ncbi:helix-turn-helix transcriptional regulator [Knoellia sp. 3-2P3]|uniref:helix-turn-helix domain-containing protein n=1 Tax=unclassified Knoellia TaxID=2618719 RepID=UPI0023DAECC9|nr:helix-turn-helix transcriptional regulator [Knoellia sp. 3-2P3]MDF2091648.1 helix-turn-helix transcriptional regulator [Knoellia sp. 3-2P3]
MRQLPLGNHLGDYLREQRQSARLSLRQLADLAGISNPYLSQIERGLKKPSAEILQQLAKGLQVSAESLYVRAGILDERPQAEPPATDTRSVIQADPRLTERQKAALLDIYDSFVGAEVAQGKAAGDTTRRRGSRSGATGKGARSATAKPGTARTTRKAAVTTARKSTTTDSTTKRTPTSNEKE